MGTRTTEKECYNCEESNYTENDHELYCENCGHTPDGPAEPPERKGVWELFWEYRQGRVDNGDRVRAVGGFPQAYWGEGAYEFTPDSEFTL